MGYYLNQNLGECTSLPLLVSERLQQAPQEGPRIALYILKTGCAVQSEICAALGLSEETVANSLLFWAGAGLLQSANGEGAGVPAPRRRLNAGEVAYAAQKSADVAGLVDTAQIILGEALSPAQMAALVTLHMEDGLPVDFILAAMAHFVAGGKRNVSYIERRLLSLKRDGVDTLSAFELYLRHQEERAQHAEFVACLLDLPADGFTGAQMNSISLWYEDFGYGDEMVEQGALRCGVNKTVKYLGGILRNWYKTGVRTPADIPDTASNIAAVNTKPVKDDFVAKKGFAVPKIKK